MIDQLIHLLHYSFVQNALLAGLLIVAAARLFDIERLRYILRGSRYDAILLIATAFSAIAINIEFAILIGAPLLSAHLSARRKKWPRPSMSAATIDTNST